MNTPLSLLLAVGLSLVQGQPATTPPAPAAPAPATAPQPADKPAEKADAPPANPERKPEAKAEPVDPYVLGFKVNDIDGKPVDLETYKGKVLIVLNVASKCGFTTEHYTELEPLYLKKKDKGLEILAFPANEFGRQEPGSNADIKEFCTKNFKVTFPIFEKIVVKGEKQHPLFKKLSAQPKPVGGDPSWNFTKWLVDRKGNVVARFEPSISPSNPDFLRKLDELLAEKAPDAKAASPKPASK